LGCKKGIIKDCLIPVPKQTGDTQSGLAAFKKTVDFFDMITSGAGGNLLPQPDNNKTKQ
jgi:hypothetical protein